MAAELSGFLSDVRANVEAVTGLSEAPVAFDPRAIPETLEGSGFVVVLRDGRMTAEGGAQLGVAGVVEVGLLYRHGPGGAASTSQTAFLDHVLALRSALESRTPSDGLAGRLVLDSFDLERFAEDHAVGIVTFTYILHFGV